MTKTRYLFGFPFATIVIGSDEIECMIDTGFDGALMLPTRIVRKFGFQKTATAECILADGTISFTELFEADIVWLEQKRKTRIIAMNTDFALIGMKLLADARTTLQPAQDILTVEPIR